MTNLFNLELIEQIADLVQYTEYHRKSYAFMDNGNDTVSVRPFSARNVSGVERLQMETDPFLAQEVLREVREGEDMILSFAQALASVFYEFRIVYKGESPVEIVIDL